jgi:hypothetical protein
MADQQWESTADHQAAPAPAATPGQWQSTSDYAGPAPSADSPSLGGFLSNAYHSALNYGTGIVNAVTSPAQTATALGNLGRGLAEYAAPQGLGLGREHEPYVDALLNQYKDKYGGLDALRHALYTDPVGVAADLATLAGGAGLIAKGVGFGADVLNASRVANIANTVAKVGSTISDVTDPLKVAGAVTGKLANATGLTTTLPQYLYRTALRPGMTNTGTTTLEEANQLARTGLQYAAPVTDKGVATIGDALNDLNNAITQRVQAGAGAGQTVSRSAVAQRLLPVEQRFGLQVAPESDLRDINRVGDQFTRTNAPDIPVTEAQAKKVGTYQQLQGKYGKLSEAEVEAQKALARGLKEELVQAMPELAHLNEQDSRLLDLQGVLEKAVNKSALGSTGGGIGSLLKTGIFLKNPALGTALVMKGVLNDPVVRSRLAIALNKAQYRVPGFKTAASMGTAASRVQQYQDSLDQYVNQPQ